MVVIIWLMASAFAGPDPALVLERIEQTAAVRSQRITTGVPAVREGDYKSAAGGSVATNIISVDGYGAKKAYGVTVVPVPIDKMWAAVNDDFGKVDNTRLAFAEVVAGTPCGPERTVFQYLPISMVSDRWWIAKQTTNAALFAATDGRVREMRWKSLDVMEPSTPTTKQWAEKGIPLKFTEGAWFLVDIDGENTLIEYYTWSDPGGSVPASIASSFAAGSIKSNFTDMVRAANKGQDPRCKGQAG